MIDFVQLQQIIKDQLEYNRTVRTVDATGATLDEAVNEAAAMLETGIRNLEYEILERGSAGFLGTGKKNWVIRAYETVRVKKKKLEEEEIFDDEELNSGANINKDGEAFVQFWTTGVHLKITPPVGGGRRANRMQAISALEMRNVKDPDLNLVDKLVEAAEGIYVKIADFHHVPMNDSLATVEVDDARMRVYITVMPPMEGGCDISFDNFISLLKQHRVYHGIKEDVLTEISDKRIYRERILVAEGQRAENGKDAYIQYLFETDQTKVNLKEGVGGKIDFKELNIIQNVFENQIVAKKIPPEKGVNGQTVSGEMIFAKSGSDIPLPVGSNVHAGEDGETIISDINGQVMLVGGKINVEPVYTVDGDVNLKTGNIIFLGTVVISGDVEDGFSVKASGNIEIKGTVSKAELDAEGDIIIYQGVNARGGGKIRAGQSLWSRFIENANVEAGNMVVVVDGIINSYVDALKSIVCIGKRAHIIGGRLRAGEEINAKVIGNSTSTTETICEVGFDPKTKQELEHLFSVRSTAEDELETLKLDLQTLINTKKQRKSLPEDKEAYMQELMDRRQILTEEVKKANEDIQKIQEYQNEMKINGKISASTKIYPGAKIMIRDVVEDIRNDFKGTTFILENGLIKPIKYEEPDEIAKKGLDGYSSN